MLYKIAAHKTHAEKLREEAQKANTAYIPILGRYINTIDYGGRSGHPVVAAFFGPAGVAGAVAKEKGVSLYGPAMKGQAISGAIEGATLGGISGLITGAALSRVGMRGVNPLALSGLGALGGAAGGAIAAPAMGTIGYGLGYLFGDTKSK